MNALNHAKSPDDTLDFCIQTQSKGFTLNRSGSIELPGSLTFKRKHRPASVMELQLR